MLTLFWKGLEGKELLFFIEVESLPKRKRMEEGNYSSLRMKVNCL